MGVEQGGGRASHGQAHGSVRCLKVKGVADGNDVKKAVEQFLA